MFQANQPHITNTFRIGVLKCCFFPRTSFFAKFLGASIAGPVITGRLTDSVAFFIGDVATELLSFILRYAFGMPSEWAYTVAGCTLILASMTFDERALPAPVLPAQPGLG